MFYEPPLPYDSDIPSRSLRVEKIGAILISYNKDDFQLIRRHKDFSLRVLVRWAARGKLLLLWAVPGVELPEMPRTALGLASGNPSPRADSHIIRLA